jgi:hypothetical protein
MSVNYFDKYTKSEVKIGNHFVKMIDSQLEYKKNNAGSNLTAIDGICNNTLIELQELTHKGAIKANNVIIDTISAFNFNDDKGDKSLSFNNPNMNVHKKGKLFTLDNDVLYLIHFEGDNHFSNSFKFTEEEEVRFLFKMVSANIDFEYIYQENGYDLRKCLQALYKPLISNPSNDKFKLTMFKASLNKNSTLKDIIKAFQVFLNIPYNRNYIPINVGKLKEYFDNNHIQMKRNNKRKYQINDNWESAFSVLNLGIIVREQLFYTQAELENLFSNTDIKQVAEIKESNNTFKKPE